MNGLAYRASSGSPEDRVAVLYFKLTTGATGAVSAATGKGLTSIVRNSAGKYTVTLLGKVRKIFKVHCTLQDTTNAVPPNGKAAMFEVISDLQPSAGVQTFIIQGLFPNGTGYAAADVADSAVVLITVEVQD